MLIGLAIAIDTHSSATASGGDPPDPGPGARLDFSDPTNSGYLVLLEDV